MEAIIPIVNIVDTPWITTMVSYVCLCEFRILGNQSICVIHLPKWQIRTMLFFISCLTLYNFINCVLSRQLLYKYSWWCKKVLCRYFLPSRWSGIVKKEIISTLSFHVSWSHFSPSFLSIVDSCCGNAWLISKLMGQHISCHCIIASILDPNVAWNFCVIMHNSNLGYSMP